MSDPTMLFIGCGAAALEHSRTLKSVAPNTRRFYASRAGEKARSFSESYDGSGWFNSYESALDDKRIDVAVITTPPANHLQLTLLALRAGKHVVVEKPAFLTPEEFYQVAEAAALNKRFVMVAENYYYKPLAVELRRLVADEAIGDLRLIWINAVKGQRPSGWRSDPELAGGGPMFEGGVHWMNLLANLGPTIVDSQIEECGGPMTTLTRVRYDNGAAGVLAYSWEMPTRLNGIHWSRMLGTKGSIVFESNGIVLRVRGDKPRLVFPGLRDITGARAMWRDFIRTVRTDCPPQFTLEGARRDVELVLSSAENYAPFSNRRL